jgi:hypothetical protein
MSRWTPRFAQAALANPNCPTSMRGDHARMLAHAAVRRRRASGQDRGYWKACAPAAIAKAAALREDRGFPRLP